MTDHRQRKHQRSLADHFSDTKYCFTQIKFFRTEQRDRLSLYASIDKCGSHHVHEIFNCERPDAFLFETNETEDWKRVQRVAQVVEHVIAATVDDAGFDDGVIEAGVAHDLFRRPL